MKRFYDLPNERKQVIYTQIGDRINLPSAAIEKDWWVTLALNVIFSLPFSEHIVFKGGTSLSKGWGLIDRFSEDVDLAIGREHFGFYGDLTKGEIRRLRKKSCEFLSTEFPDKIKSKIEEMGISDIELSVKDFHASDTDPIVIQLFYPSLTEKADYLAPQVLIEIGSRSLMEPTEKRLIRSMVAEGFPDLAFADHAVEIPIVLPKRTFLEKAFLLHEEFQRPAEKILIERRSRHYYDLEKMMDSFHGKEALLDTELYRSIVAHREKFSRMAGVDYASLSLGTINFIPPDNLMKAFALDYKTMQESMIYGDSLPFAKLMKRMEELLGRFREIA